LLSGCPPPPARRLLLLTDNQMSDEHSNELFGLSLFIAALERAGYSLSLRRIGPRRSGLSRSSRGTPPFRFSELFDDGHARYDAVFLFGWERMSSDGRGECLEPDDLRWMRRFMNEAGGGVFATGDHGEIGSYLAAGLPRVRAMRHWKAQQNKDVLPMDVGGSRLSTLCPGDLESEQQACQAPTQVQRILPNFASRSHYGRAHPLLAHRGGRALNVLPAHAHEGRCLCPQHLDDPDEWPRSEQAFPRPEIVCWSVSSGTGFELNEPDPEWPLRYTPLEPRTFPSIVAYDGHAVQVGRIVTQASLHHFVDGDLAPIRDRNGLHWNMIERYFLNLAAWISEPLPQAAAAVPAGATPATSSSEPLWPA
jgi:hypothetical protein